MDRFIPNRSTSNLDSAAYGLAADAGEAENQEAASPSQVRGGGRWGARGAQQSAHRAEQATERPRRAQPRAQLRPRALAR